MRHALTIVATAVLLIGSATIAEAKQCRDAAGKFTACPAAAAAKPCRDATGKFVRCSAAAASTAARPASAHVGVPSGATARCKDGTYWTIKAHAGACARHGGVATWL